MKEWRGGWTTPSCEEGAGESKKIVKSLEIFGSLNKKP